MRRFHGIAMLGLMAAALAVNPMAAPPPRPKAAPKPKDEQDLEREAIRTAPMTETSAPTDNWLRRSNGMPHQGKREMMRRMKRMREGRA